MPKRIAIACQGGGSHTAFTAGVLSHWTSHWPEKLELVALSGTSGGALCAALTWSAAVEGKLTQAEERLKAFWEDNSARSPFDAGLNLALVWAATLRGLVPTPEISPYAVPAYGEAQFRRLLEKHLDFPKLNRLRTKKHSPILQVAAVEVMEGDFTIFDSSEKPMQVEMLLASAAIPNLFRAVQIGDKFYWDGLFSHNPPLLSLVSCGVDEIWIIGVNPRRAFGLPRTPEEIEDRRNELAGNLSLEQEIQSINTINLLLDTGELCSERCRKVKLRRMGLDFDLNYSSKLDRSPRFLESLIKEGEKQGKLFLDELTACLK